MAMSGVFDKQKKACLTGLDLSRKGSVDAPIHHLVGYINDQTDFFTTSSCSGRIMVVDNDVSGEVRKQGCKWIFTSHDCACLEDLISSLDKIERNAVFKFEPFVLHVQCRYLEHAQCVLNAAVSSGFRNSGISVGNKGKFITAVRSTHSLEVPLSCDGHLLVSNEYLTFLVQQANSKMKENLIRIERFFDAFKSSVQNVSIGIPRKSKRDRKQQVTGSKDMSRSIVDVPATQAAAAGETKDADRDPEDEDSVVFDCSLFDGDG